MSKVVDALKVMLANPKAITEVTPAESDDSPELFFLYNGKYKWSVTKHGSDHFVYYYPGKESLVELADLDDWEGFNNYVFYASKKLEPEANVLMSQLYEMVNDRRFNMDEVLDEIIKAPPRT